MVGLGSWKKIPLNAVQLNVELITVMSKKVTCLEEPIWLLDHPLKEKQNKFKLHHAVLKINS